MSFGSINRVRQPLNHWRKKPGQGKLNVVDGPSDSPFTARMILSGKWDVIGRKANGYVLLRERRVYK